MEAGFDLTPITGPLFSHFYEIAAVGGFLFYGVPLLVAARSRKPREEADGIWLKDHDDTWAGVMMGIFQTLPFLGFSALGAVACYVVYMQMGLSPVLILPAIFAAVGPMALLSALAKLRVPLEMEAGELRVERWPLMARSTTTMLFRRRLKREATLNGIAACLVRYERRSTGSGKNRTTTVVAVETHNIENVTGAVRGDCLEATLTVDLPSPIRQGDTATRMMMGGLNDLSAMFNVTPESFWHLEIMPDFDGVSDENSTFQLELDGESAPITPTEALGFVPYAPPSPPVSGDPAEPSSSRPFRGG